MAPYAARHGKGWKIVCFTGMFFTKITPYTLFRQIDLFSSTSALFWRFFLNKYIFYRQGLKAIEKGLNELIHWFIKIAYPLYFNDFFIFFPDKVLKPLKKERKETKKNNTQMP